MPIYGMPAGYGRPAAGSWLGRLFAAPHPDAFRAGLREDGRWRIRPSAVDPYQPDGVVTMRFGDRTLRLRPHHVGGDGARPGHREVLAFDADTERELTLSVPAGDVERFGLEA